MAYKADWRKRSKRKGAAPGGQEITSPDVRSFGFRALSATQDSRGAGWLAGWLAAPSQAKEKRHGKAERKRQHWRKRIGYETERDWFRPWPGTRRRRRTGKGDEYATRSSRILTWLCSLEYRRNSPLFSVNAAGVTSAKTTTIFHVPADFRFKLGLTTGEVLLRRLRIDSERASWRLRRNLKVFLDIKLVVGTINGGKSQVSRLL